MERVHRWVFDDQLLEDLDGGNHGHVLVVMHVVSDHHKRAGLPLNPSTGCEQGHLQVGVGN